MFGLGSTSGLTAASKEAAGKKPTDTAAPSETTQDTKKASESYTKARLQLKSLAVKLNEMTTGLFNKTETKTEQLAETSPSATSEASKADETPAEAADKEGGEGQEASAADAAADKKEEEKSFLDSTKETLSEAAAKAKEYKDKAYDYVATGVNGAIEAVQKGVDYATDAAASTYDFLSGVRDAANGYLDELDDMTGGLVSDFKNGFCSAGAFPQCASCPKRPNLGSGADSGWGLGKLLGTLACITDLARKGLEGLATDLIGCPGIAQAAISGDFDSIKKGCVNGAINGAASAAVSAGQSMLTGAIAGIVPEGENGDLIKTYAGDLIKNTTSDQIGMVNGMLRGQGMDAMSIFGDSGLGNPLDEVRGALSSGWTGHGLSKYQQMAGPDVVISCNIMKTSIDNQVRADLRDGTHNFGDNFASMAKGAGLMINGRLESMKLETTRTKNLTANDLSNIVDSPPVEVWKTSYGVDAVMNGTPSPADVDVREYGLATSSLYAVA